MTLLAYEATREVRVQTTTNRTPVAPTTGVRLSEPLPLIVPIHAQASACSRAW